VRSGSGTVLLVEDERIVRVATVRVLKQLGYQVIACGDGDEAVDLYRERRQEIAAVMLDMLMPRMSGLETFLALREIDHDVPVLLTTGFADDDEVQEILDLGVRDFIAKPYELGALSRALARVITGITAV
jgi:CheY-like chemotaxis protein